MWPLGSVLVPPNPLPNLPLASISLLVDSDQAAALQPHDFKINNLQKRKPLPSNKHRALKLYKVFENKSKCYLKHLSLCIYIHNHIKLQREKRNLAER